jgi:polyhydroxybutyrate depolymerase
MDENLTPILDEVQSNFSQAALQELQPVLTGARSVKQDGSKVTIERDQPSSIGLQGQFLNDNIRVTSLNFGNSVTFDFDRQSRTISNIEGVSLNVSFMGADKAIAVKKVTLEEGAGGQKTINAEFENPLPGTAQRIFGTPNVFNVRIDHTGTGFNNPKLSEMFSEAAGKTGPSIAGLLASDALTEASKIALFAESNPKWIKDVVDPAIRSVYEEVLGPQRQPQAEAQPPMSVRLEPTPPPAQAQGTMQPRSWGRGKETTPHNPVDVNGNKVDITKPGDYVLTSKVDGADRTFHVHVPPNYDGSKPVPLVLLLHGHAQDGDEIARHSKLNDLADREGFIAVYPDATAWSGRERWRAWDTDNGLLPPGSDTNDVGFLRQIIESTEKNYKIDPKRIYMGGMSNGGMMTYRAAGELSDKLAAVAIISGAMSGKEPPIKSPLSVYTVHGTDDQIVPYDGLRNVPDSLHAIGLPTFKSNDYAAEFWTEQNKITGAPRISESGGITEKRWTNADGTEVVQRSIHGDDHIPDNINGVVTGIWDFFKAHPKVDGPVSGTKQPEPIKPFDITARVKAHVQARGVQGLEMDSGDLLNEVENLVDGSFSPANGVKYFEERTGIKLEDKAGTLLKATDRVTKTGQHIDIDLTDPQTINIDQGSGGIKIKSVRLDDPSFDLIKVNNRPWFSNIEGVNFSVNAMGRDMSVDVKEIGQKLDGNGAPYYEMRTSNPLPAWARTALFAKSQIPIELKLNANGVPTVMNESQIKDATLGLNPVTRGYMDVATHVNDLSNELSWKNALNVGKDVAIIGGTGFGAYKLAALKFATKGRIGAVAATVGLVAPSLIHGIERLID